jgi:hypothetical protein
MRLRRLHTAAAVRAWTTAICCVALLAVACAEPPNKEIGQAQGAVDAARAAGADRYATEEYTAATQALKEAGDAVTQRDYRLALNHAIESREHAQNAARQAAETRARLRGDVERSLAQVAALLAQANARMAAAEQARVPRRALREAQQALARVNADVQKAGAAMKAEDYAPAQTALNGMKERIEAVIASLDTIGGAQAQRRRP